MAAQEIALVNSTGNSDNHTLAQGGFRVAFSLGAAKTAAAYVKAGPDGTATARVHRLDPVQALSRPSHWFRFHRLFSILARICL